MIADGKMEVGGGEMEGELEWMNGKRKKKRLWERQGRKSKKKKKKSLSVNATVTRWATLLPDVPEMFRAFKVCELEAIEQSFQSP